MKILVVLIMVLTRLTASLGGLLNPPMAEKPGIVKATTVEVVASAPQQVYGPVLVDAYVPKHSHPEVSSLTTEDYATRFFIKKCAEDGSICKTLGHMWKKVTLDRPEYFVINTDTYTEYRKCPLCGWAESRKMGVWGKEERPMDQWR